MNSIPFISHHLFVEAIRNEGYASSRQKRSDKPSGKEATLANALSLEVLDDRKPLPTGSAGPLRVAVGRTLN